MACDELVWHGKGIYALRMNEINKKAQVYNIKGRKPNNGFKMCRSEQITWVPRKKNYSRIYSLPEIPQIFSSLFKVYANKTTTLDMFA